MRNDMGWCLWWQRLGPFTFGMDLATWGIGFLFAFRFPRGLSANIGPFYLTIEGADFEQWLIRHANRIGNRLERRMDELILVLEARALRRDQRRAAKRAAKEI